MIGGQSGDSSNPQNLITGDHLERIACEFGQLKNSLTICSGDVGGDNSKQNGEVNKLSEMLLKKMQELFVACLSLNKEGLGEMTDGQVQLKHVLKSYALLSMQRQAEQLFKVFMAQARVMALDAAQLDDILVMGKLVPDSQASTLQEPPL